MGWAGVWIKNKKCGHHHQISQHLYIFENIFSKSYFIVNILKQLFLPDRDLKDLIEFALQLCGLEGTKFQYNKQSRQKFGAQNQ